jgi:hypothetical protein
MIELLLVIFLITLTSTTGSSIPSNEPSRVIFSETHTNINVEFPINGSAVSKGYNISMDNDLLFCPGKGIRIERSSFISSYFSFCFVDFINSSYEIKFNPFVGTSYSKLDCLSCTTSSCKNCTQAFNKPINLPYKDHSYSIEKRNYGWIAQSQNESSPYISVNQTSFISTTSAFWPDTPGINMIMTLLFLL